MSRRRKFSGDFKARVALEAIQGLKTINEIASEYEVHPNQVANWKRELVSKAPEIFSNGNTREVKKEDELKDRLYRQIGQLQVELEWLKKKHKF
jgi:putative transposase